MGENKNMTGTTYIDDVVVDTVSTQPSLAIGDAKDRPDATAVSLWAKSVTFAPRDSFGVRSTSYFSIEEADRSAGIRVDDGLVGADSVRVGDCVTIRGVMRTSPETGERYVELSAIPYAVPGVLIRSVGMSTKTVHLDAKVIGELVTVAGTVREVAADGTWFTIADGYCAKRAEVKTKVVVVGSPVVRIAVGQMVTVTGVVSKEGTGPASAYRVILRRSAGVRDPLINLSAGDLPLGPVTTWTNTGTLGASLGRDGTNPQVQDIAGRRCVTFSGSDRMKATFTAPSGITGNGDYTVAAWVYNPALAYEECYLSWAHRGGPACTCCQMNYGSSPDWGAVTHWEWPDMGFGSAGPPSTGTWHHLAVTYDGSVEEVYLDGALRNSESKVLNLWSNDPVYLGCAFSDSSGGGKTLYLSGSIASLQVYDCALTAVEIGLLLSGG